MPGSARWVILALLVLGGCGDDDVSLVQGYVEGEYVRVGLPAAGRVVSLVVDKGERVEAGAVLFALDDRAERAALAEAAARLEQARFQRDDLRTGKRALEIRALEARKAQAEADLRLAATQLRRQEDLITTAATSRANLDTARATVDRARARVAELAADLAFAGEGGRSAEVRAAEAAVAAAEAAVTRAQWQLDQRTAAAPAAAVVDDVLFRPGEEVAAGQPVVSLLPPGNVVVRFYLGPAAIARLPPYATVGLSCTGCPPGLTGWVSFVAHEASYAPPVIYSRDSTEKLVFLVEAKPAAAADRLRPGQPVTVLLPAAAPGAGPAR